MHDAASRDRGPATVNGSHARAPLLIRRDLLNLVNSSGSRLVSVVAPAGFGKTTLAEMIATDAISGIVCDVASVESAFEFAICIVEALAGSAPAASTLAADLFALVPADSTTAQLEAFVLEAWHAHRHPQTWVFDNLEAIADQPDSLALLVGLIKSAGERRIVLCSRPPLLILNSRLIPPNEHLALRAEDLAFSLDEISAIFGGMLDAAHLERVEAITAGWPVAVLLMHQLAFSNRLERMLDSDLGSASGLGDLWDYLLDEVLGSLGEHLVNVLLALVATRSGGVEAVFRTDPNLESSSLRKLAQALPLVRQNDEGRYRVHPLIVSLLEGTRLATLERLRSIAAASYERDGMLAEAARLYLADGRSEEAAKCLELVLGSYLDHNAFAGLHDLLENIPNDVLRKHPRLWTNLVYVRRSFVDLDDLIREGVALRRSLRSRPTSLEAKEVDAVLVSLSSYVGRHDLAETILSEHPLRGGEYMPGDAALLVAATIRTCLIGRTKDAPEQYRECLPLIHNDLVLSYFIMRVEVAVDIICGRFDAARANLTRAVASAEKSAPWGLMAELRHLQGVIAWFEGDDATVDERFASLSGVSAGVGLGNFASLDAAWRTGSIGLLDNEPIARRRALALLMMAAKASEPEARTALLVGAESAANVARDLWLQTLVLIARGLGDPKHRETFLRQAFADAAAIGQQAFADSVRSLLEGGEGAPSLTAFARRFVSNEHGAPRGIRVSVLSRTVFDGNQRIALSNRVWSLIEILAVLRRARRETIVEHLWGEEAIDSGAQALKVLISRARQQLGFPALIEVRSGYVALHRDVAVDLDEVEKLLRSLPAHGTLSDAHRDQLRANYEQFKGSLTSGESSGATTPIESAIVATRHDIVERLAKDALEREQIPLAVDLANELRRQDSNDEAAHELLIRAHLHSGDRTSALREYRIYGERLKKDLGIDPDFTIEQIKNELDAFPALTIERRRLRRPSTGTDPPLKESR